MNECNDYSIVPFGSDCTVAECLVALKMRNVSLPFDWTPMSSMKGFPEVFDSILKGDHSYLDHDKFLILHPSSVSFKKKYKWKSRNLTFDPNFAVNGSGSDLKLWREIHSSAIKDNTNTILKNTWPHDDFYGKFDEESSKLKRRSERLGQLLKSGNLLNLYHNKIGRLLPRFFVLICGICFSHQ